MAKVFRTGMTLAVLAFVWFMLVPTSIGGFATYITVQGISMQPNLYTDDLVILHKQGNYQVGDVIAFRSSLNEAVIVHRIIGVNGPGYVMQGDNNNFIDRDQPTTDEILGKMTVRIPGGSKFVDWVKEPAGMAVMVAIGTLLMFSSLIFGSGGKSRHKRRDGAPLGRPGGGRINLVSEEPFGPHLGDNVRADRGIPADAKNANTSSEHSTRSGLEENQNNRAGTFA